MTIGKNHILNERLNDKEIEIVELFGYDDGYYWDYNATILYDGNTYHILDVGSGSGYTPNHHGVIKGDFNRLNNWTTSRVDDDALDHFEDQIVYLMEKFIKSGAQTSYERDCENDVTWIDDEVFPNYANEENDEDDDDDN